MAEFVSHQVSERVATVTIDRPGVHNAFNDIVIAELTDAFVRLAETSDVAVVVLASEGKSFCAGADVHCMKRMVDYSVDENVKDADALAKMLLTIRQCPKPVIARVHGAAIGGGVGLVAACDMAVAVSSAVFSLSEVRLGIIPAVISPFVLDKIGPAATRRYALTAERFKADEARRIGLVCEVVDTIKELDAEVVRLCTQIKSNGPRALAECKRLLSDLAPNDWKRIQSLTVQRIAELRVSEEGQEGLKAFLEKRPPRWKA